MCHSFFTQNIVDAMAGSKNWKAAAKDSKLDKMHADITKIFADFYCDLQVELKINCDSFEKKSHDSIHTAQVAHKAKLAVISKCGEKFVEDYQERDEIR